MPITDPTWNFFVVLGIILFAPMLLERLRVPSIVGLIFAGVLIGPHGFGVLERDDSFELFGKVGLYYIMFLASLEMNLQDVQKIKGRALTLGLLSFAIPMVIGFGVNRAVLPGYTVAAAVLMAAMYASHTLISYPIVLRYGISRLPSVSIAVGGTIVADTLTLLVLAVVGGMFKEQVTGLYWLWLVVKVMLIGAGILIAFPSIGRWFFRRYDDGVVQYIFVLVLVFLGAGLMEMVGIEGILGAFLAGLALNRLIPPTSPLMSHVEFVGNALFIPYFLIGVGMLIDLRALGHSGAILVAAVMTLTSIVTKWLAAFSTQKIFKMQPDDRRLMFGLTGARAAATLAVVLVGYKIILPDGTRLLDDDVLNGAMVLILVTCVVSSLVTDRAARKMATRGTPADAQADAPKGGRIVLAISNPETVRPLVHIALMLQPEREEGSITALNVVLENNPAAAAEGGKGLQKAVKIAAAANVKIQTHSRWSVNVVSGISHTVKEQNATDLLIGLHQKSKLTESFYGKLTSDLLAVVDRQILIYRGVIPANTVRHMHIAVPRRAEFETGFAQWTERLAQIAAQTGCAVTVYGVRQTLAAVEKQWKGKGQSLAATYQEYNSWRDLLPLAHDTRQDHLMAFVCAHKGGISYHHYFEHLPDQIERNFSTRNLLIVYPSRAGRGGNASAFLGN
ncbi:MAG: cation:proton antiporter [Bacteroidales bacterium]|nr:cation:proton antiporter [Bacteroidales bacterium]